MATAVESSVRSGAPKRRRAARQWRFIDLQRKDVRISLRISGTDVMKLKALARMRATKFRTYVVEILKREIGSEEERLAAVKLKRQARELLDEE